MSTSAGQVATDLTLESVVIRGGALPLNRGMLCNNADAVHELTQEWGECVGSHPTLSHEEIAARWRFSGPTYVATTVGELAALGFDIKRDGDYHGVLLLLQQPTGKTDPMWDLLDEAFAGDIYPNPRHNKKDQPNA